MLEADNQEKSKVFLNLQEQSKALPEKSKKAILPNPMEGKNSILAQDPEANPLAKTL